MPFGWGRACERFFRNLKQQKEKTFDSRIKKDLKTAQRSLNKFKKVEYACYKDAETAVENWLSGHKMFQLEELSIESKSRRMNGKRGRPKKGKILETYYSVKAKIQVYEQIITRERENWGVLFWQPMIHALRLMKSCHTTRVRVKSSVGSDF